MDSFDLLARENEFKKLNKQLEKKTESLMKQIEHVMQKQDIFPDFSQNLWNTTSTTYSIKHRCDSKKASSLHSSNSDQKNMSHCLITASNRTKEKVKDEFRKSIVDDTSAEDKEQDNYNCSQQVLCHNCMFNKDGRLNNDLEFLYAFVSVNVNENILPQSFLKERVTVENVCKFLAAKVKLMQEQLNKMQNTMDKKTKQCEGHLTQLAELESERMTLLNRANSTRAEAADTRAKYMVMLNKLDEKERLYKEQRSVTDRLTVEVKQLRSKNSSLEARAAAQEDAVATLKQRLETAKMSEKEFRDSTRNLSASHQNAICRLEARAKHLTSCIDKQNALIDNLKRQNALLTTEGALKALEKEYNEFLNQDFSHNK